MLPSLEELIAPIAALPPCGEDMSFSTEFDAIQEARREDDPSLEQGDWVTELKEADWKEAAKLSIKLLSTQTKDLRLGSWLCESLAKTEGVSGLGFGYQLIDKLVENYWDALHPVAEDGDQEQRIGNIAWLLSRSIQLVREFPLVQYQGEAYGLTDLEGARALQSAIDRNQDIDEDEVRNKPNLQKIKSAQSKTPTAFYQQSIQDVEACIAAAKNLAVKLDDKLGMDGPSFSNLIAALDAYADTLKKMGAENGLSTGAPAADTAHADTGAQSDAFAEPIHAAHPGAPAVLRTREQALKQLRDVAAFFRRTEPHSPVAYLADKAATWGEMPLHQWLKTVLKEDNSSLSRFEDLLGFGSDNDN